MGLIHELEARSWRAEILAATRVTAAIAAALAGLAGLAGLGGTTATATAASLAGPTGPAWHSAQAGGRASAEAVSPDGTTIYVTGYTTTLTNSAANYRTIAYNAVSGAPLWTATYSGPVGQDQAVAIAVSPLGTSVYVTGSSRGTNDVIQIATVAYATATGTQQWVARHAGETANAIAVSPNGSRVYISAFNGEGRSGPDMTIAYDAATGSQRWLRYQSGSNLAGLAISPGGRTVYLLGHSTVAYNSSTGATRWSRGFAGVQPDTPIAGAVSPNGKTVFVTGPAFNDYDTIAYSAATGKQLWNKRYDDPAHRTDTPHSIAVGPDGNAVYVTGSSRGVGSKGGAGFDYATVAYSAAAGKPLWVKRYAGPTKATDGGRVATVSRSGHTVYVTGSVHLTFTPGVPPTTYATVAYAAATGAQQWVTLYNPATGCNNTVAGAVMSQDGSQLFVAGSSLSLSGTPAISYEIFAYRI